MDTIGKRIKQRREARQMDQIDLAKRIGIAGASINQIESGETKMPRPTTLMKIAEVLETNQHWLLTGQGHADSRDSIVSDLVAVNQFEELDAVHKDMVKAMIATLTNMQRAKQ
jgi:transcriptional regulator with XRE-family HTH domain